MLWRATEILGMPGVAAALSHAMSSLSSIYPAHSGSCGGQPGAAEMTGYRPEQPQPLVWQVKRLGYVCEHHSLWQCEVNDRGGMQS